MCREETKEGVCPKLASGSMPTSCTDECQSDSDCSGDKKCCYNGCARSCLPAVLDPGVQILGPDEESLQDPVVVDRNSAKIRVVSALNFFRLLEIHAVNYAFFKWI